MLSHSSLARCGCAALVILSFAGCSETQSVPPTSPLQPTTAYAAKTAGVPSPIVDLAIPGSSTLHLYPFVGATFGAVQIEGDPINIFFIGNAKPLGLRAALLALDGDRTNFGMPDLFPFNCTWSDASGDTQAAYVEPQGWIPSGIQLQCGDYVPMRFHLRLFDAGTVTIGGTHMDLNIPGTQQHEVISWEVARQIVMVDFVRSGYLAAPPAFTDVFTPTPSFRTIPAQVYNGIPTGLRAVIGGPAADQTADVPIPSDGKAVVLNLASTPDPEREVVRRTFAIEFNQFIPKPFCPATPGDLVHVDGPLVFDQHVIVTASGNYVSQIHATGHLDITPISPPGSPFRAMVNAHAKAIVTDNVTLASDAQLQIMLPPGAPGHGRLTFTFRVGPDGVTVFSTETRCSN